MTDKNYMVLFEKYLRGESTAEETEALIDLIGSEDKFKEMLEVELMNADPTIDETIKKRIFGKIRLETTREKSYLSVNWRKAMQWAAIFLLPVLSAFTVYYFTQRPQRNLQPTVITAQKGEKAEVVLPDGSNVWINSGSTLTYDRHFNGKERSVYLQGEAYFEVTENKKRPFIVHTKHITVQALGTSFNVRSYETDSLASAVLLEGKVKVSASGHETILSVNERATFDKRKQTLLADRVEALNFIEWKNGNIYFSNQTYDEIARALSRIYNVEIQFASEQLRPMRFSGTLGSSGIKNALDILSMTSPMYYEMKDTTIILHHKAEMVK
ncbi:MAG: FecR domain-containing protein [Petrimonas sp.]|jgi:ferric-dicitrate binding protein FerR (iron transport regulator)|uniref:Protein FecR n=1 Tax=bioreactor metagenome TaxID=1076179 RepID=A0A644X9M3_9ZZZZ|nr:FecR domain-containing protein [Proteiniphilum sp. UBA5218]MDD2311617.1 FecR domain-containing protein [Petrimonas sp.]HAC73648.1 iron dicitrate transport regulator FecR [Porphyromonadaceae bacterium]MDD2910967.1 FecR domain-containing protein [Petrimonas sp.]MDD4014121.1 FecR domain-containing protein [Petrimonas sp.]MDD4845490.1 FecR domain-containing protein [Petrimonas sp.]